MPCTQVPLARDSHTGPAPELRWEPALTQLRSLPPPELDRLVRSWLSRFARREQLSVRTCERGSGWTTYHARFDSPLLATSLRVRVHQRRSRLQVHHVEAFAGHLVRAAVPSGILVTTGGITREARTIASSYRLPHLRLYSGAEWAEELASHRLGLKRRSLWRWILDLGGTGCTDAESSCLTPRGGAR